MADLNGFDANSVEPADDFEPIPAGKYVAVIIDSAMKPTKSGNGSYLELTFQVLEGQYANRLLWARLNIDNPNATAVQIAKQELASICRAVGVFKLNDSLELHDLPLVIHVRIKMREDTGEPINEIRGFSKKELPAVPQPTPTVPAVNRTPAVTAVNRTPAVTAIYRTPPSTPPFKP